MIPLHHRPVSSHNSDRSSHGGQYINFLAFATLLLFFTTALLLCFDKDGFNCYCSSFSRPSTPPPPPPNKDIIMPDDCPSNFAKYVTAAYRPNLFFYFYKKSRYIHNKIKYLYIIIHSILIKTIIDTLNNFMIQAAEGH